MKPLGIRTCLALAFLAALALAACMVSETTPRNVLKISLDRVTDSVFQARAGSFDSIRIDLRTAEGQALQDRFYVGPYLKNGDTLIVILRGEPPARFQIVISAFEGKTVALRFRIAHPKDGKGTVVLLGPGAVPDTVPGQPQSVDILTASPVAMAVGGSALRLQAQVKPAGADSALAWSSSADSIATVDSSGVVTPHAPGSAVITARSRSAAGLFDTLTVKVSSQPLSELTGLVPSRGEFTAPFQPALTAYSARVPFQDSVISLTPTGAGTLKVAGKETASGSPSAPIALKVDTNIILITVQASGKLPNTYTVTVNREKEVADPTLTDATLSDLQVRGGTLSPPFESGVVRYTVDLPAATAKAAVIARASSAKASLTMNGSPVASGDSSFQATLAGGDSTSVAVVVTPQKGAARTYTIGIRRPKPSEDADLSGLTATATTLQGTAAAVLQPPFSPTTHEYVLPIPSSTFSVKLKPTASHPGARISYKNLPLASGTETEGITLNDPPSSHEAILTVVSESNKLATYHIHLRRPADVLFSLHISYLQRSENGGGDWSPVPGTSGMAFHGMHFTDASTGFASGDGVIMKTIDQGKTWTKLTIGTDKLLYSVDFWDKDIGVATGSMDVMLKTTNGGASWSTLHIPTEGTGFFFCAEFTGPNTLFVGDYGGSIHRTTDGGMIWARHVMPALGGPPINDIHFTDKQTGFAVSGKGHIFKTADGGLNWSAVASGTNGPLYQLSFPNAAVGYAAGASDSTGTAGAVFKTTNGGLSWRRLETPDSKVFRSIHFTDPANGLVSNGLNQLRTRDGGASWSVELSLPIGSDKLYMIPY